MHAMTSRHLSVLLSGTQHSKILRLTLTLWRSLLPHGHILCQTGLSNYFSFLTSGHSDAQPQAP